MGNAPSKIPLKFGADPGVATQQIFSRRIYWRNIWNRALTQRQGGAGGNQRSHLQEVNTTVTATRGQKDRAQEQLGPEYTSVGHFHSLRNS